jgi:hypothetical protein
MQISAKLKKRLADGNALAYFVPSSVTKKKFMRLMFLLERWSQCLKRYFILAESGAT